MACIVLLQNDLRLEDNPALFYAAQKDKELLVVYIEPLVQGDSQKWWHRESLILLKKELVEHHIQLIFFTGMIDDLINQLKKKIAIDAIYWNDIDQDMSSYETDINKKFYPNYLFLPEEIKREFKLCKPFFSYCLKTISIKKPLKNPDFKKVHSTKKYDFKKYAFPENTIKKERKDFWKVGEQAAQERWKVFKKNFLDDYDSNRNVLSDYKSSLLSPYLKAGNISIRWLWKALETVPESEGKRIFISELGWREFSYNLLFHNKDLATVPLKKEFKHFPWNYNQAHFIAWKEGKTGMPLIDAAMRQLKTIGWMNNRVRMVVASFLTKNLLIPWQKGEEWFFEQLVDADVASNGTNWQWVAGSGTDSAPYFRIFSPLIQSKTYDPEGIFIKQWIPELKGIEKKYVHEPLLTKKKVKNYPELIIDMQKSRKKALEAYNELKK